jgi:SAM-dependent methyltransferase
MMQVATATASEATWYVVASAHQAPLATGTADLVTVAQALHWFIGEPFYAEVRRVLRPGGVFAAWTYGLPHFVSEQLERSVHRFIDDRLGPYWLPEIRLVLDGYASIDLPCAEIEVPPFEMRAQWTLDSFLAFVRTWSGVRRYVETHREDPVDHLAEELREIYGGDHEPQPVSWQIKLRACRR